MEIIEQYPNGSVTAQVCFRYDAGSPALAQEIADQVLDLLARLAGSAWSRSGETSA